MGLEHLRAFVAVAEERSVRRAALRLHISQPPLSRRIASLEDELGAALFVRTRTGMELAPAGAALVPRARAILDAVDDAVRAIHALTPASLTARAPEHPRRD